MVFAICHISFEFFSFSKFVEINGQCLQGAYLKNIIDEIKKSCEYLITKI